MSLLPSFTQHTEDNGHAKLLMREREQPISCFWGFLPSFFFFVFSVALHS